MNCKSRNLINSIRYLHCEEIYIGQTGNSYQHQISDLNIFQLIFDDHLETCNKDIFLIPFFTDFK